MARPAAPSSVAQSLRKFRSYGAGALLSNDLWGTLGPPGFSFAELDQTETELDRAETEIDRADSVPKLNYSISGGTPVREIE